MRWILAVPYENRAQKVKIKNQSRAVIGRRLKRCKSNSLNFDFLKTEKEVSKRLVPSAPHFVCSQQIYSSNLKPKNMKFQLVVLGFGSGYNSTPPTIRLQLTRT